MAVLDEVSRLRLENDMLRKEEARLSELKRMLSRGSPEMPFHCHRSWADLGSSMIGFRGQTHDGVAHGWGTALFSSGESLTGEFEDGNASGLAACIDALGDLLLSRFLSSCPVQRGIAWSADRSLVVETIDGLPVRFLDSPADARCLVDDEFGDVAVDLLSSISPPVILPPSVPSTVAATPPLQTRGSTWTGYAPSRPASSKSKSPPRSQPMGEAPMIGAQAAPALSPPSSHSILPSLQVPDVRTR